MRVIDIDPFERTLRSFDLPLTAAEVIPYVLKAFACWLNDSDPRKRSQGPSPSVSALAPFCKLEGSHPWEKVSFQVAQNCHNGRIKQALNSWAHMDFPKAGHSIGNGEVDSSILSGSTISPKKKSGG
jgi:hypothetical protein